MHIQNLYRNQEILLFNERFALEKIHGSSAHISWKDKQLHYFSGGEKHENFIKIFNETELLEKIKEYPDMTIFGEVYGGKCQGMSATYGKELSFVAFDVKIGESWLNVPNAEEIVLKLGLDFVPYSKIETKIGLIDAERDKPSRQAKKKGIIEDKISEGVVLRPLVEMKDTRGDRIIAKHKRIEFSERKTEIKDLDPEKLQVLEEARSIAMEWVTQNRLDNILSHIPEYSIEDTGKVIKLMIEDIMREGNGEIVFNKEVSKQIGKETANLFKRLVFNVSIEENKRESV